MASSSCQIKDDWPAWISSEYFRRGWKITWNHWGRNLWWWADFPAIFWCSTYLFDLFWNFREYWVIFIQTVHSEWTPYHRQSYKMAISTWVKSDCKGHQHMGKIKPVSGADFPESDPLMLTNAFMMYGYVISLYTYIYICIHTYIFWFNTDLSL